MTSNKAINKTHHLTLKGEICYYFSKTKLFLATLILGIPISVMVFFINLLYKDNFSSAMIMLGGLLIIVIFMLPRYIRFLYFFIAKRPAIMITSNLLIDNINMREYKWSEIEQITLKHSTGRYHYIYTAVILKNGNREIQIQHKAIDCKANEFLNTLIRYHKKFKGRK